MRHGSLFSGIGGFDLGFERAGIETIWQVEIDDYCRRVLARHFPNAKRYDDVRTVGAANLAPVDILSGGFPCQDISNAGKRVGIDGERSGLWSEYARIICELRPRFVVVENVAALLGRGMERVLGDLAAGGYDAEWQSIRASDVGAPHRRERIWIVAYPGHRVNAERSRSPRREKWERASKRVEPGSGREDVADAFQSRLEGHAGNGAGRTGRPQPQRPVSAESLRNAKIFTEWTGLCADEPDRERGRRFSYADWWAVEPNVGRVADGVPLELDCIGRLNVWASDNPQAKSEAQRLIWRIVQFVWVNQELAATSPDVYRERLCGLVHSMPREAAQNGWLLGSRLKEEKELCDLWHRVYAVSFQEAQDMLPELLERIGKAKRPQEVASRADRLKGLGNAIVPQIAEFIGRKIMEASNEHSTSNARS